MTVMHKTHRSQIFFSEEMRKFERSNFKKKSSYVFMKRAGYEVFKFINNKFKKRQSIIVLCGPGNNGGDGFVTANYLLNKGYKIACIPTSKVYHLGGATLDKSQPIKTFLNYRNNLLNPV